LDTIYALLPVEVRRTNAFLRAVLALFTGVVVAAAVGLLFVSFHIRTTSASALTLAVCGIVSLTAADYLVRTFGLYRHGVEETLAVGSAVLFTLAVVISFSSPLNRTGLVPFALAAFGVYLRFGFVYSAVLSVACAGLFPFQLHVSSVTAHLLSAAVFLTAFCAARAMFARHSNDVRGEEYDTIQAAAFAGLYLVLNLHVVDILGGRETSRPDAWFYWGTYAATWIFPAAALIGAIRNKDRPLLTVGLASALVTLATNKPYLGWPRQSWDPIVLGVLLIGSAMVVRRWLAAGSDRQRGGFTAARLTARDSHVLNALATASAMWPEHGHQPPPADPAASNFSGGRSGGGGGGGTF
jgi:hypothetical protein